MLCWREISINDFSFAGIVPNSVLLSETEDCNSCWLAFRFPRILLMTSKISGFSLAISSFNWMI